MNDLMNSHSRHVPHCQLYAERCPFCNLIVREQTDAYPGMIEELFRPIVSRFWKRWDAEGVPIANNTDLDTLTYHLALSALSRWVQPKYHDILGLSEEEIMSHPIVLQKRGGK